jgi:recombinational DNA repair protein RecR
MANPEERMENLMGPDPEEQAAYIEQLENALMDEHTRHVVEGEFGETCHHFDEEGPCEICDLLNRPRGTPPATHILSDRVTHP